MFAGEVLSAVFLGIGEFGSIISRGLFGLIVGICDVLAACMCCCQVPFSDRPDRDGYTYSTLALTTPVVNKTRFSNASLANLSKRLVVEKATAEESSEAAGSESDDTTKVAAAEDEVAVVTPTQKDKPEEEAKAAITTPSPNDKKAKAKLKAKLAQEKKEKKLAANEEKKKKVEEVREDYHEIVYLANRTDVHFPY